MNTTDYNDGNWHGWNGGECPVHPEAEVTIATTCGMKNFDTLAKMCSWDRLVNPIVAFRVTKEHKVPQEYWLCYVHTWDTPHVHTYAPKDDGYYNKVTHVREVETND
jgi:hypothetical protein